MLMNRFLIDEIPEEILMNDYAFDIVMRIVSQNHLSNEFRAVLKEDAEKHIMK